MRQEAIRQNPVMTTIQIGDLTCPHVIAQLGDKSTVLMVAESNNGPFISIGNRANKPALEVTAGPSLSIVFTNQCAIDNMREMLDRAEKILKQAAATDEGYRERLLSGLGFTKGVLELAFNLADASGSELDQIGDGMGIPRVETFAADSVETLKSLNGKGFPVYVNVGGAKFPYEVGSKGYDLAGLRSLNEKYENYAAYQAAQSGLHPACR